MHTPADLLGWQAHFAQYPPMVVMLGRVLSVMLGYVVKKEDYASVAKDMIPFMEVRDAAAE